MGSTRRLWRPRWKRLSRVQPGRPRRERLSSWLSSHLAGRRVSQCGFAARLFTDRVGVSFTHFSEQSRSRSLAISARRTTTGPVETHRGGCRLVHFRTVWQLFHSAHRAQTSPRSPLHRPRSKRLTNTTTEYSLPGATQLSQVRSFSSQRAGSLSLVLALNCTGRDCVRHSGGGWSWSERLT